MGRAMPDGLLSPPPGRTYIMGVVNVTPDSFSDGGRFLRFDHAVGHALELIEHGADLLDIGGESTRPGAEPASEAEELDRVAPVVAELAKNARVPLSIDTRKPAVAAECLRLGARIVNDVGGLLDPEMLRVTAEAGAAAVAMHMRGDPRTMQADTQYGDLIGEIKAFLAERLAAARAAGVAEVAIDPGLGFGKSAEQNFVLLRRLAEFAELGAPVLAGPSRKSFLGSLASRLPPEERVEGTIAACCAAALAGASIVRVHDVKACKRALEVIDRIRAA